MNYFHCCVALFSFTRFDSRITRLPSSNYPQLHFQSNITSTRQEIWEFLQSVAILPLYSLLLTLSIFI
nr:hypothetical protein Iba_chr13eCG12070 [Ipomoea batatas]